MDNKGDVLITILYVTYAVNAFSLLFVLSFLLFRVIPYLPFRVLGLRVDRYPNIVAFVFIFGQHFLQELGCRHSIFSREAKVSIGSQGK